MHHFIKESRIAAPPGVVFAFHESPGAFEALIPPWENVRVVDPPSSLKPGTRVILKTKIGPFPVTWVAEHTEYVPGKLFADRQVRGPFAYWFHRHRFLDDGQGGTILRTKSTTVHPWASWETCLEPGFWSRSFRKMFDYRHETTKSIVESGEFASASNEPARRPLIQGNQPRGAIAGFTSAWHR